MAFFKRIEVWVLLALTVAAVVAVMRMEQADGGRGGGSDGASDVGGDDGGAVVEAVLRNRVRAMIIERDGDHAVVEILLQVDDAESGAVEKARLVRADGSEVAAFFAPYRAEVASPVTAGVGEKDRRSLLFWADRNALSGALFLEFDGESLPVKAADGFDLGSIDDGGRQELPIDGGKADAKTGGASS